jgi:hypothetical protein
MGNCAYFPVRAILYPNFLIGDYQKRRGEELSGISLPQTRSPHNMHLCWGHVLDWYVILETWANDAPLILGQAGELVIR